MFAKIVKIFRGKKQKQGYPQQLATGNPHLTADFYTGTVPVLLNCYLQLHDAILSAG
jgi:hypothetical protein